MIPFSTPSENRLRREKGKTDASQNDGQTLLRPERKRFFRLSHKLFTWYLAALWLDWKSFETELMTWASLSSAWCCPSFRTAGEVGENKGVAVVVATVAIVLLMFLLPLLLLFCCWFCCRCCYCFVVVVVFCCFLLLLLLFLPLFFQFYFCCCWFSPSTQWLSPVFCCGDSTPDAFRGVLSNPVQSSSTKHLSCVSESIPGRSAQRS